VETLSQNLEVILWCECYLQDCAIVAVNIILGGSILAISGAG
jgi:hypothetical protein